LCSSFLPARWSVFHIVLAAWSQAQNNLSSMSRPIGKLPFPAKVAHKSHKPFPSGGGEFWTPLSIKHPWSAQRARYGKSTPVSLHLRRVLRPRVTADKAIGRATARLCALGLRCPACLKLWRCADVRPDSHRKTWSGGSATDFSPHVSIATNCNGD